MPSTPPSVSRPAYRPPWTNGAKAYQEADTWEALEQGMKRKRKVQWVSVPTAILADIPCGVCGTDCDQPYLVNPTDTRLHTPPERTTIQFHPRNKTFTASHYYCGWGALLIQIHELGHRLGY